MTRTISEALDKFELIQGAGSEASGKACAMTALCWVAGEAWTDAPTCAHPLLRDLVIRANDDPATTPAQRKKIVRAGAKGVLDTWWIPVEVVALAISKAPKNGSEVDHVLAIIRSIAEWKSGGHPKPNLRSADLSSADLSYANLSSADLSYANLSSADLSSADLSYANLSSADLSYADLSYADLSYANLRSADLSYANLRYAIGNQSTVFPVGAKWKVSDSGLVVPA